MQIDKKKTACLTDSIPSDSKNKPNMKPNIFFSFFLKPFWPSWCNEGENNKRAQQFASVALQIAEKLEINHNANRSTAPINNNNGHNNGTNEWNISKWTRLMGFGQDWWLGAGRITQASLQYRCAAADKRRRCNPIHPAGSALLAHKDASLHFSLKVFYLFKNGSYPTYIYVSIHKYIYIVRTCTAINIENGRLLQLLLSSLGPSSSMNTSLRLLQSH